MVLHGRPRFFNGRETIPSTNILLEGVFFGKNEVGKVNHLAGCHGDVAMVGHVDEIIDGVEDDVNGSSNSVSHRGDRDFLCFHLLIRDSSVGRKKMMKDITNASILARLAVQ